MLENNKPFNKIDFIFKYSTDNNTLPIIWVDKDGNIIYYNKSVLNYIDDEELIGMYVYRLASDIQENNWIKLWNILQKRRNYKFTYDFYNKVKDKIFILDVNAVRVTLDNKDYCYLSINDITELVETNNKLLKERDRAEESDRLKNAFLSNMSHEIRTPMNAIVGFSEILDDNIEDYLKEYTKIILTNVEYLLSLIDNIITISRIDSEQIKVKKTSINMYDLINNVHIHFLNKIGKLPSSINIILDNEDENDIIISDRYIIEESLNMLISNAIKFTTDGDINIGYKIQNNNIIIIYVRDNGIGIRNKYHEIIFDRFRQINKQTVGSGLGLSIFKSYMKMLNGRYTLNSNIDIGTNISFQLEIDNIKKKIDKTIIKKSELKRLKNKKILIAEDIEINQLLFHDMLTPYGVNIIKCMDGNECIEKFTEIKDIDLILMDLDMPCLDGYEATEIIRQTDKVIPIIAQTAYSQKENREKVRRIGFTDFIKKPLIKDEILKIIIKYL